MKAIWLGTKGVDMKRLIVITVATLILQGCASTHIVSVEYEPSVAVSPIGALEEGVRVGAFQDKRGTDSRWIGAIRGGYGNVLKRLVTHQPTTDVVREALIAGLRARSVELSSNGGAVSIEGEILKLDCSYYFNREAHAHLLVKVVSVDRRSVLYAQTYQTDNRESGVGAGILGNVKHLADFERRTLNETVDKIFADPAFVEALRSKAVEAPQDGKSTEGRLRTLDKLRSDGLITDEEYKLKRQQILESL
jgi:hypothetical protein